MATRYDISDVPPQGGYVAKQCPVRAQWDAIVPCEPLSPSPALQHRFDRGRAFEAEIFARLTDLHAGAIMLADEDRERKGERETATVAAMLDGADLIIGGRLPADQVAKRVGEPDLLVAAGPGRRGYHAVDVKHHRTLRRRDGSPQRPALCSPLAAMPLECAAPDAEFTARIRREDMLQLAHYQRMLEAAGLAADDGRHGGIVGVESVVTWYDLDAPIWATPSVSDGRKLRSTMEVYDFEFDFRLDIIAVAAAHREDPSVGLLVVPVRIGECANCPWWSWCGPELAAGSGDVSLLPRIGWRQWRVHRDHGVADRAALASLDYPTATLVARGLDLRPVLAAASALPGDTPLTDVLSQAGQLAGFAEAGITCLADASALDPRTASYSDEPMGDLPTQIDQARAALGPSPAYRRRRTGQVVVPRGDIEVDIDMENTTDGVYLWGALLSCRTSLAGYRSGYYPFCSWEPMTTEVETRLFTAFWQWLTRVRQQAAAAGLIFRAYCYHAAAENTQLRRLAELTGVTRDVDDFTGSAHWVDLLRVFDDQLITGSSSGLKAVASLAGYAWTVDDPGGGEATVRYDLAVGPDAELAETARRWLLDYNEGDTRATLALRDWLDHKASDCPPVEEATW